MGFHLNQKTTTRNMIQKMILTWKTIFTWKSQIWNTVIMNKQYVHNAQ